MNTAQRVPRPWANHCCLGDVWRRKPTRKSPVRSVAWLAPTLVRAPPRRFSVWDLCTGQPWLLVELPRTICEALEAPVSGVMSGELVRGSGSIEEWERACL